jgi:hypothetical protein
MIYKDLLYVSNITIPEIFLFKAKPNICYNYKQPHCGLLGDTYMHVIVYTEGDIQNIHSCAHSADICHVGGKNCPLNAD